MKSLLCSLAARSARASLAAQPAAAAPPPPAARSPHRRISRVAARRRRHAPSSAPGKLTLERAQSRSRCSSSRLRAGAGAVEAAHGRVDHAQGRARPTVALGATRRRRLEVARPCDSAIRPATCGGFFDPSGVDRARRAARTGGSTTSARPQREHPRRRGSTPRRAAAGDRHDHARHPARRRDRVPRGDRARAAGRGRRGDGEERGGATSIRPSGSSPRRPRIRSRSRRRSRAPPTRGRRSRRRRATQAIALANLRAAIGWLDPTRDAGRRSELAGAARPATRRSSPRSSRPRASTAPRSSQLDKQIVAAEASIDAAHAERRPVLSATAQHRSGRPRHRATGTPQPAGAPASRCRGSCTTAAAAAADVAGRATRTSRVALAQRDALLVTLTSQLDSARAQIVANRANVAASTEAVDRRAAPSSSSPTRATRRASAARSSSPTRRPRSRPPRAT